MATKRAKMTQRPSTLDDLIASGVRYQPLEEQAQAEPDQPSSLTRRILGDGGISLLKGAVGVPEAAVGLADLVSGGRAGRALEQGVDIGGVNLGFRPKRAKEALDQMLTPEQQKANQAVQEAQGFLDTTMAALQNPSTILHAATESVPVMGAGGVVGRALMAGTMRAAPGLSARIGAANAAPLVASQGAQTAAKYAPVIAGAAGEGVITMGSQAESIRQETPDGLLTGEQSALAAGSGFITGGLSVLGGAIAAKLGITDIDTLLVGKHSPEVTKGFTRRVLEGAVSEGLLEELPQSVQEQVAQNLALGKPLGEGVSQAAVLGMFSGGLMGGGSNLVGGRSPSSAIRQEKLEPTGPVAGAINAGLEDTAKQAEAIEAAAVPAAAPQPVPVQPVPPDAQPMPGAEVAQAAPADVVPDANAGAFEQRQADKPPEPAVAAEPGERVLKTMDTAMRAKARAGEGAEIVPVAGGVVVRKVDAETGELVPAAAPAAAPELPGVEAAPPAPPPAAALPDDTLNPQGKPFTNRGAAANTMRKMGKEYTVAQVDGGFAVRKLASVAAPVDQAAHAAATSPTNDLPEPTQAQKEGGNYKLGHHRLAGLDLSIENPAGSTRKGVDRDGKAWENTLRHHYGYIKGSIGADKDHVDAFVKPGTSDDWGGMVFVVDQVHPDTGKFDEHKALLGFSDMEEAKAAYAENYAKGWKGLKAISAMPVTEFNAWVRSDAPKSGPLVPIKGAADEAKPVDMAGAAAGPDAAAGGNRADSQVPVAADGGLKRRGFNPTGPGPGEWVLPVSGLGDVIAKVVSKPGEPIRAEISADYMGKRLDTRTAEGDAAIDEAIQRAKDGINEGRERMAREVIANERGLPNTAAPAIAAPAPKPKPVSAEEWKHLTTHPSAAAWDATLPKDRVPVLLRAGWMDKSPGTQAMMAKPWADLTPSQKARITKAMEPAEAAPATAPVKAPAPAEIAAGMSESQGAQTPPTAGAPTPKPLSTAQVGQAFDLMVERDRDTLSGVLFNWREAELSPDGDKIVMRPGRDGQFSKGSEGGKAGGRKGEFIAWLRSEEPFDAKVYGSSATDKGWRSEIEGLRRIVDEALASAPATAAPAAPKRSKAAQKAADSRIDTLKAYFKPGNVVKSYGGGFDEVLSLDLKDDGGFSVKVHPVTKGQASGQWVRLGKPQDARQHSTFPDGRELAAGPVAQLMHVPGDQVSYTEGRADGKPFPNAPDRGTKPEATPAPAVAAPAPAPTVKDSLTPAEAPASTKDSATETPVSETDKGNPTPSANTIFTEDAAAAARARLKSKLGRLQSGLDPETIMDGITLAGYHIEKGARTFAAYAKAMVGDLGDGVKPYLQSWYMAVRGDPRASGFKEDMDRASVVEDITDEQIDAMVAPDGDGQQDELDAEMRSYEAKADAKAAPPQVPADRPTPEQIELRKRVSVLESLRRCIG